MDSSVYTGPTGVAMFATFDGWFRVYGFGFRVCSQRVSMIDSILRVDHLLLALSLALIGRTRNPKLETYSFGDPTSLSVSLQLLQSNPKPETRNSKPFSVCPFLF